MPLAQDKPVSGGILSDFRTYFQKFPIEVNEKLDKRKGTSQMRGFGLMGKLYDSSAYFGCSGNQCSEINFGCFVIVSGVFRVQSD